MNKCENDNRVFDLQLVGFNFSAGLITLAALRSGIKVAISINEKLTTDFEPELSIFFPSTVAQTQTSFSDVQFLLKCSSLFPHLYFPKRTLFLHSGRKINSTLNITFDQLLRRDRETSSLSFITVKSIDYQKLSNSFERGALVYEYQFDRNRATIELLKMCLAEGAVSIAQNQTVHAKKLLRCVPFESQRYFTRINRDYPYPNPIRVKKPQFEFVLNSIHSGTFLQIYFTKTLLYEADFIVQVKLIFEQLNIDFPEKLDDWLKQIHFNYAETKDIFELEMTDAPLPDLRKKITQLQQKIENQLKVKISLKKLFTEYQAKAMTGENFRSIQNECDEKFDLAKQTGIDYKTFSHLFYRYRFQIDAMIDSAYELMNHERNPLTIWLKAESDFKISNGIPKLNAHNNIRW